MVRETHYRSIAKAVTYRLVGTVATFFVAWILSRDLRISVGMGIADPVVKIGIFYIHERLWNRSNFGKMKPPDYQI